MGHFVGVYTAELPKLQSVIGSKSAEHYSSILEASGGQFNHHPTTHQRIADAIQELLAGSFPSGELAESHYYIYAFQGHEVIFRNGDRLDCRRENLAVVTKQEARQHHLHARSNSKSGIKGISYNPRPRTWSVDIYRNGQAKRVGTFLTLKEAQDAHQGHFGARIPTACCARKGRTPEHPGTESARPAG